jgi:hypothetical protein
MFKHISQPFDNVCGQTCCAMITGLPVNWFIDAVGQCKTNPKQLRWLLNQSGWEMDLAGNKLPNYPIGPALLNCTTVWDYKEIHHWMFWTGERLLDPSAGARADLTPNWAGTFYNVTKV